MRKPRNKPSGKWVFVPEESQNESVDVLVKKQEDEDKWSYLETQAGLYHSMHKEDKDYNPFAPLNEFENLFPGSNMVPDGGTWIMVKKSPHTEFTVPPFSFWFAEPWPMQKTRYDPHRVKIVTPRGDLGLFPCEYSLVTDPEKYYEFMGQGITAKFFGNDEVPKSIADAMFYIRSRGIDKKDALVMLVGKIKCHGILWLEADKQLSEVFGLAYPNEDRLATI